MTQQPGLCGQRQPLLPLVQVRKQDVEPQGKPITELARYSHTTLSYLETQNDQLVSLRVHFLRDMLGHVHKTQQPMIAAAIRGIFQATSLAEARARLAEVVDKLATTAPKVATLLEAAEAELLAFYELPSEHWSKLRSTNPLERVNREIGRRTDVVGIFPNDAALLRLAGMLLIEQNDEWLVARRYLSQESLALVLDPEPAPAIKEVAQLTRA
jgi:Transposase, Mutator family